MKHFIVKCDILLLHGPNYPYQPPEGGPCQVDVPSHLHMEHVLHMWHILPTCAIFWASFEAYNGLYYSPTTHQKVAHVWKMWHLTYTWSMYSTCAIFFQHGPYSEPHLKSITACIIAPPSIRRWPMSGRCAISPPHGACTPHVPYLTNMGHILSLICGL